jgi:gamma-glutamylcyclotransferase (GGCT)/AIG2-like uncharacterized protein YtfP
MNLHKTKNKIKIAVFCELREHLKNNHILKNCKKIGEFLSAPEFQLIKNSYNEAGLKNGNSSVIFEVYEINTLILEEISKLKAFYYVNYENNLNEKKLINTPYGKAIVYIDKHTKITNENTITDYDYVDYYSYNLKLTK